MVKGLGVQVMYKDIDIVEIVEIDCVDSHYFSCGKRKDQRSN